MTDGAPGSVWQNAFNIAFGVVVALGAFILRLYKNKVDDLAKAHATFVTRDELKTMFAEMREDRHRMHTENLGAATQLREDIRAIHGRIDLVFTNGAGKHV